MSFETTLSEMIAKIGLPAPDVGDRREMAWPKILAAFQQLINVARAAPRECICHVRSFDGYYGSAHTEPCLALSMALKGLTL